MRFIDIVYGLEGYVHIQAEGVFLERFLNICTRRDLDIRNIRYCGTGRLTADMSVDAFKSIRSVCRRTRTHIRIIKKHGLPFFLHRYRKRKFVLPVIALILIFFWYSSGHIMGITVFGNQKISTDEILEHLSRSGVVLGQSTKNIDSDTIRNRLMTELDELAWLGVNVNGSRVYVEVVERLHKEEVIDRSAPCHLIASKDGIIKSIEARDGQSMVKIGAGVRKGDVLVSGIMDNPAIGFRYVHAYGEVFAETEYSLEGEYPLDFLDLKDTGKVSNKHTLRLLNLKIPLFVKSSSPYEHSSMEEETKEYRLPFDFLPSVFIHTIKYNEQTATERTRTYKEALETAKAELSEKIKDSIPENCEILHQDIWDTMTETGSLKVKLTVTCLENIAEKLPFSPDEISDT